MIKESDKTEFEAMLHSVNEMKKTATDLNRPYVDEKTLKFAKDAISEYEEVQKYLVSQINKNITIWLNLDNIKVIGSQYYQITSGVPLRTAIGDFEIIFKVDTSLVRKCWGYCTIDNISVARDGIVITDVDFNTENCVRKYDTLLGREKPDLSLLYSSRGWSAIHNKSLLTQKYTKGLWEAAIGALKSRMAAFKDEAAKAEDSKAKVDKVGEYQKVTTI